MEDAPRIAPVADAQRLVLLDVLRGIAVLGILLANIPWMAMSVMLEHRLGAKVGGDHWTDHVAYSAVFLFADTKFITIFSTLFGAGLGLMSEKALANHAPFAGRYARRLGVLLLFGFAHATLLWFGDILFFYGLVGFAAMWFRKCRVKTLLIWSGVLLTLNFLLFSGIGFLDESDTGIDPAKNAKDVARSAAALSGGTFAEMTATRFELFAGGILPLVLVFGPRTLGLFLLGLAIMRSGAMHRLVTNRRTLFRAIGLGVGLGMPLQIVALVGGYHVEDMWARVTFMSCLYVGGLLMALAYVAATALWTHTNLWLGLRARLAAVGRMALTNYITHSMVTSLVFNIGGQYDRWARPWLLLLVFAIFAAQLWISPIWLRRFRFGPLEWVWRAATYGRLVPMRRE